MNIIYILADDLGYGDLGCTGSTKIKTPNIDRLAEEGMIFTQHYAGCTVSAPSRSALMTGQHTGHTPIRGNKGMEKEGQQPLPKNTYTIARMLKTQGYETGIFGKWGLGAPNTDGTPLKQGFDSFYGYNCQRLAHRYYPKYLWKNDEKVIMKGNSEFVPTEYSADIIHSQAMKFIEENSEKPFFLFMSYTLPHAELLVPEDEILQSYRGKFEERPFHSRQGEYGPGMNEGQYSSQEEPYAVYAAMVSRLDRYVGDVIKQLEKLGIKDNTLVMFSSDNGPHKEGGANPIYFNSSGPFRGIKRDLTEGGIHLPLIAWAPGRIAAKSHSEHICASWDMLPTFAELTGAKIPKDVKIDGISILPTLFGNNSRQRQHDYLYWEFHEKDGKIAVRKGNWKAIKSNVKRETSKIALYDLSNDIMEQNDLATEYPEIVSEMDSIMHAAHIETKSFPFEFEKETK